MSDAPKFEFGFSAVGHGPPLPPNLRVAFAPIAAGTTQKLVENFRKRLIEPMPEPPQQVQAQAQAGPHAVIEPPPLLVSVGVPPHAPLGGEIYRYSGTAMRAVWIHRMSIEVGTNRRVGEVQAVSLFLTGLDRDADNCAISIARQMRFGEHPIPVNPQVFDKLIDDERPLAVQLFCQPLARIDPSIGLCFGAMGIAFFGSLGVEGTPPPNFPKG